MTLMYIKKNHKNSDYVCIEEHKSENFSSVYWNLKGKGVFTIFE